MGARDALFAPALDAVGLHSDRVIYAKAGRARTVLVTMEEGLRHVGLAGVVGELSGHLTLTASRGAIRRDLLRTQAQPQP